MGVALALLASLLPGMPAATAATAVSLLVSDNADRSQSRPLDATTLTGAVAVHLGGVGPAVGILQSVTFYLDDPQRSGPAHSVELFSPYDFNGTTANAIGCSVCPDSPATLYDTSLNREGKHSISAEVRRRTGEVEVVHAEFLVDHGDDIPLELAAPPPAPGVSTSVADATRFLYDSPVPPQVGVAPGTIDEQRAGLVRGRVLDQAGQPLVNADISILGHPQYGTTRSRADGAFDMAVNGGQALTVHITKDGLLPAQRQVDVGWDDYALIGDVALVALDEKVTTVEPQAVPAGEFAVARSSTMSDEDGTRTSTLLVPGGVEAEMVLADGSREPLSQLSLRQTEFTVGPSGERNMPGELPPGSAYTYAVDLSVDQARDAGARAVEFSEPLWHYNENFLAFPAGTAVPAGYYDYDKAAWVPSDNGLVIAVVAETGGRTDLDITGDGVAEGDEELAAIGVTSVEREQLAALYDAGQSLWRVPISHFSPWDFNWGFGFPADARSPLLELLDSAAGLVLPNCTARGSVIGCEDQTLGEHVDLVGTGIDLAYSSARLPGYRSRASIDVAVSGDEVPASLKRIEVEVEIVGRGFKESLVAASNQRYTLDWDGVDGYGRLLRGEQPATVRVGYVYDAAYEDTASFGSFGDGARLTADRSRAEATIWQETETTVATAAVADARGMGLGGWTLSAHHSYDPRTNTLMMGDGTAVQALPRLSVIETVAGTGEAGFSGDGGAAVAAALHAPGGLAVGAGGELFVADQRNDRVRRVAGDGTVATVAGDGTFGFGGDGAAATLASMASPLELALDAWGNVYIADVDNHRVRRLSPDGVMTTVAGNGTRGSSGDGGPATEASLAEPTGVVVDGDGTIYVADFADHRVRRVAPDGRITTVAGTGSPGSTGDGGPAAVAELREPSALALDGEGNLYVADSGNDRVRRIAADGRITTVAGSGVFGTGGDGGPATAAQLAVPSGLALDRSGNLYVAEQAGNRVRRIGSDGIITTVAGTGKRGFAGDDGPAARAGLANARALAAAPDGTLYVADADNHRVRRVTPPLPHSSLETILVPAPDGSAVFEFDRLGRHQRTLDGLTGVEQLRFAYDPNGRLSQVRDLNDNVTTIERPSPGQAVIVGPFGARSELSLDDDGYLQRVTNPAGESVAATYHPGGLLASFTDARSATSSYDYDDRGRLVAAQGRDGQRTTLERAGTDAGYRVSATTPLGRQTVYELIQHPDGALERRTSGPTGVVQSELRRPDGSTTVSVDGATLTQGLAADPRWGMAAPIPASASFAAPGQAPVGATMARTLALEDPADPLRVRSRTDTYTVGDRTWTTTYDRSSATLRTTSPEGRTSEVTLDEKGRVATQRTGELQPLRYGYDDAGRIEVLTQGEGEEARVIRYRYDDAGRLASVTDPLSVETTFGYDDAGRVTSATGPRGQVGATYDANANLATLSPPSRAAYRLSVAVDDRLEGYQLPGADGEADGAASGYRLNHDRQYEAVVRPDGTEATFGYDAEGRLRSMVAPGGETTWGYGADGRLASVAAPSGVTQATSYTGVLATGTTWSGPVAGSVSATFDAELRLASQSVNATAAVSYGYDDDGLVTSAGPLALTRHPQLGHVSATTLGTVSSATSVDDLGQLSSLESSAGGASLYHASYGHDDLGRITTRTETIAGQAVTETYHYQAGRLVELRRDGAPVATYAYDDAGNRSRADTGATSQSATYDGVDQVLTAGTEVFTHSANGELETRSDTTTGATTSYRYDNGRLVGAELPDGRHVEYRLDGAGRRVAKSVDGTLVQGLLYAGDQVVAETDGAGNVVSRFVYATRAHVPDYFTRDGRTYRVVSDHLGSVRLVVDTADGAVVQRIDYDAFGQRLADSNPGLQPFGFAGGLTDADTGLVAFGARSYDPGLGRFTTRDPVGFAGGLNHYAYVGGDPVNLIDPSGLSALGCLQDVLGLAGMVPVVGGAFDIANAAIYASRGDWGDAALAAGAILLPVSLAGLGGGVRAGARFADDAAEAESSVVSAVVHGNARLSTKTTYLYRLSDDSGNYLKTGITSNPGGRYSQKYLLDKRLDFLTSGSRSDMLNLERFIVERDPGPLNFERWAGDFARDIP